MQITRNKGDIILVILFIFIQALLLYFIGIYTKEESTKYLEESANLLNNGHFSEPKYLFYSGYIGVHVIARATGIGITGVYIIQLLLNGIATICFYNLTETITNNKLVARLATAMLICCIPFQAWTTFLFTESFFFSILLIYIFLLFKKTYSAASIILAIFIGALVVISRPTGLLIIPASTLLLAMRLYRSERKLLAALSFIPAILIFAALGNLAMKGQGEFDFMKPFIEQHVICGLEGEKYNADLPADGNSLGGLVYYITHNFPQSIKLAGQRMLAFFGLIRPYYSTLHNILLIAAFYPVYIFAIVGIRSVYKTNRQFVIFFLVLLLTFTLSVLVSCDDWHNRFIMPVMPVILLFAARGFYQTFSRSSFL
ncbi:MAG TPA: hypothetical protein VJT83_03125 [Chitinophagaceae bacterium]|nr:hypothetical protein [Chitinophagaceae bacterium]